MVGKTRDRWPRGISRQVKHYGRTTDPPKLLRRKLASLEFLSLGILVVNAHFRLIARRWVVGTLRCVHLHRLVMDFTPFSNSIVLEEDNVKLGNVRAKGAQDAAQQEAHPMPAPRSHAQACEL